MAVFILEDALSVQTDKFMRLWPFLYEGRIIRLDELGQTFVVRLNMRLKYKDGRTRRIMRMDEFSSEIRLARRKVVRLDA